MTCAVSLCVCIASIVMTAPARPVNALSSSRTAGISFDRASAATWPRTAPMPCASAATRCGAFPSLSFAPRTVLPSTAMTSLADNVANPVLACPHGICEYLQCCWLLERPCRDHKVLQKLFANPPLVMWLGYIMICELVEHGGA